MIVVPLADLPEAEPLPTALLEPGSESWQRGLRLVDRSDGAGGRITAGSWRSGAFRTSHFTFGGHEWMWVMEGRIQISAGSRHWTISPGEAGVIPAGFRCTWTQSDPVTKVFLRWDGTLPDQPGLPWLSSEPRRTFSYVGHEGMLLATANAATWLSPARQIQITMNDATACVTDVSISKSTN